MALLGILFVGLLIGVLLITKKFINSAPSDSSSVDRRLKIIGGTFSWTLLGAWVYFGLQFFEAYDKSYAILSKYSEFEDFLYNRVTNLAIYLFEQGEIYSGSRIVILRENYIYFVLSFLGAFLALFILWKITNPPDKDLELNTKFRRIGIIFSILFVILFLLQGLFSSILIIYDYLN